MQKPKRSKYRAVRCEVDGIKFDSKREAARWLELVALQKAGKIHGLQRQVKLRLCAFTNSLQDSCIGHYVADFTYCTHGMGQQIHHADGTCQVEDVKGFRTALYRWKKKHVEMQYRISIRET